MKTMLLMGAIGAAPGSSPAATRLLCSATCRLASTTWAAMQTKLHLLLLERLRERERVRERESSAL